MPSNDQVELDVSACFQEQDLPHLLDFPERSIPPEAEGDTNPRESRIAGRVQARAQNPPRVQTWFRAQNPVKNLQANQVKNLQANHTQANHTQAHHANQNTDPRPRAHAEKVDKRGESTKPSHRGIDEKMNMK